MKKMILLLTIFVFVGCAGNAAMIKKEMAANPIADGKGRIVIYRLNSFGGSGNRLDILIDGEVVTQMAVGSIFYKDLIANEYDIQMPKPFGDEMIRVKVQTAEITYVKLYRSVRSAFGGGSNIEQVNPKRAINEIKALGESEAGRLNDPENH